MRPLAMPSEDAAETGNREDERRMIRPLPDDVIERLAELWCEALLANLRRDPPVKRRLVLVADKDAA
jgi:hypothetical protein